MMTTAQIVARAGRRLTKQAIGCFIAMPILGLVLATLGISVEIAAPVAIFSLIFFIFVMPFVHGKKRMLQAFSDVDDVYELRSANIGPYTIDKMMDKYPSEFAAVLERFRTYRFVDDITVTPETIVWKGRLMRPHEQYLVLNESGIRHKERFISWDNVHDPHIYVTSEDTSLTYRSERISEFIRLDGIAIKHLELMHLVHVYRHRYKASQAAGK